MSQPLTPAIEDYLKVIYSLSLEHERASTQQIADCLGVSPASVTGMLKRLAVHDPPLVEYHRHHGVRLTLPGQRAALEVIRHHRLLELFLQERLGYSWDEVHAEADRLEHVISEELEERIAVALGNPLHDPHGEPIPARDLSLPEQSLTRLSTLSPGQQAQVEQVSDTSPELLRHLSRLGLTLQAQLEVLECSPFDDNLLVQVAGQAAPVVLGLRVTKSICVKLIMARPPTPAIPRQ
jgi:DtxR family Mn-dependent transcriptional regulator